MSLLKIIDTAKNDPRNQRANGWGDIDQWNLTKANFKTREEAERVYNTLFETYASLTTQDREKREAIHHKPSLGYADKECANSELKYRHHMWIDEHDDGFFVCMSCSDDRTTQEFEKIAKETLENIDWYFERFNLRMDVSNEINKYMEATHSVEVDLTDQDYNDTVKAAFEEVANDSSFTHSLYVDTIDRADLGVKRLKAYFLSSADAQNFQTRCRAMDTFASNEGLVREFPAAKPKQLKPAIAA